MVRDQEVVHIAQLMGGVYLHVRTCRCTLLSYLGNGWADCAEIWCVARDQLAKRFTQVKSGLSLHVRTCAPLFRISETAGRITLKFGVWLETH